MKNLSPSQNSKPFLVPKKNNSFQLGKHFYRNVCWKVRSLQIKEGKKISSEIAFFQKKKKKNSLFSLSSSQKKRKSFNKKKKKKNFRSMKTESLKRLSKFKVLLIIEREKLHLKKKYISLYFCAILTHCFHLN